MRLILPILTSAFIINGCATQRPASIGQSGGPEIVKFGSEPSGALISLSDDKNPDFFETCITPCEMTLETLPSIDFKAVKEGYLPKATENLFYRNPAHTAFSLALIEATTGRKHHYGQKTISIQFYTEEEQRQRDILKAEKEDAKRKETEKIDAALADNSLAPCGRDKPSTAPSPDMDAVPLVRIPPRMPASANKSGHCKVSININESGRVTDAMTTYCTDEIFQQASVKSVMKWVYQPKLTNGVPTSRCGVETKISYRMMNAKGKLLPE